MLRPHLKTFLTVCESGSFNKAAAELYITPSAVLQQIHTLESELGATLFARSSKGVTLTAEGEYLRQTGKALVQMDEQIHREIRHVGAENRTICIGTSIMEKVRLLYELWVLFSAENGHCDIQMLNIDAMHNIPERTDLIESVNGDIGWQQAWEFFEICKVPFGFAVAGNHPLADRSLLTVQDLKDQTVLSLTSGNNETMQELLRFLRNEKIRVSIHSGAEVNPLWSSGFSRNILLVPLCWKDILINAVTIPFEKEFLIPYGVFYRPEPQPAVRQFLEFIFATYGAGNTSGIVPVLE
ncbi:MAG: LysR family transcriptional regulator [Oscillospiraceae bacterium]|nr:LysR family transcriptional regulator [Oscillospiraceae bacterium]